MSFLQKITPFFAFKVFWPLALSLLAGCSAIYGESFDCPAGTGTKCKSISEVNTLVERGEIGRKEPASPSLQEESTLEHDSLPLFNSASSSLPSLGIIRRPEKTLRVWLAPHIDESGVYVSERYVYTVVEPGAWVETKGAASSTSLTPSKRP